MSLHHAMIGSVLSALRTGMLGLLFCALAAGCQRSGTVPRPKTDVRTAAASLPAARIDDTLTAAMRRAASL